MKIRVGFIVPFLGALLFFSSCADPNKITFDGIESVQLRGVTPSQIGLDVGVNMINTSHHNVTLAEATIVVNNGSRKILDVKLQEPALLHRRSEEVVVLPLVVHFEGMFGALSAMPTLVRHLRDCTISGEVVLRSGLGRKRIQFSEVSIEQQFGLTTFDQLQDFLEHYKY